MKNPDKRATSKMLLQHPFLSAYEKTSMNFEQV